MIRLTNVSAGYGPCDVIQDISLEANKGEFIALLGPNGCGKSTLLKTIGGLIAPRTGGEIFLNERSLNTFSIKERATKIGFLAQSRTAQPDMIVKDILEIGRAPYRGHLGKISADGRRAIEQAVKSTALDALIQRKFGQLSGGEQARVLLARALVVDAGLLLVDEPIAALDPFYQISTMETLQMESDRGKTVIAALHDLSMAAHFCDRIWLMNKGKIIADGAVEDTLTATNIKAAYNVSVSKTYLDLLRSGQVTFRE